MTDCKAGFNDPVHDAQAVFRYALDAMAHPGLWYELRSMPQVLPGFSPAATALALTLLDHEVGVWLGASARRGVNALSLITGARRVDRPDEADFAFLAANELDVSESVFYTPADWAWGSALGGLLVGTWHQGGTVVAAPMEGFDAGAAFEVLEEYGVTEALVPPTALRMMMNAEAPAGLPLETIASAGEPVTPEILAWADEALEGVSVNEYYGQTELNLVVANASRWFETQPGSMGKPLPGYDVRVVDPEVGVPLRACLKDR